MSVAITAVPSPTGGIESPPGANSLSERPLTEFVASQTAASGIPHLANPAALASELFGSLRGYLERAQIHQSATKRLQSSREEGVGANLAIAGEPRADLHSGPARENLEPADAHGGASSAAEVSIKELARAQHLALEVVSFMLETTVVVSGTKQTTNSVQSLLKGQ